MQSFEKRAGLTDTGYKPHKGLAAEESQYYRMAQPLQVSQHAMPKIKPRPKFGFLDHLCDFCYFL